MVAAQTFAWMSEMEQTNDEQPNITFGRKTRKITRADLERVNLPKVFWRARSDQIQDKAVRDMVMLYRQNIDDHIRNGRGVGFAGNTGVGKTSAATCLLKQAIARGFTSYFVTHAEMRDLVFDDKRLFGDGSDGLTVNQQIERAEFLVLDGFDAPFLVDKAFGPLQLERLLLKRSTRLKTTVLTTRVPDGIKEKESLFDVMSSCMAPVWIKGVNMRDSVKQSLVEKVYGDL